MSGGSRDPMAGALRAWREDGESRFKVAEIELPITGDNRALEAAARARARRIEAEIAYAYCLGSPNSTAWWQVWGGFDLELEIAYAAVVARTDVGGLLDAFDPADNPYQCETIDDYRDVLFVEYRDRLSPADLRRGLAAWHDQLPDPARRCFERDLRHWLDDRGLDDKPAAKRPARPKPAGAPAKAKPRRPARRRRTAS
jgi:hypothetical protein